MAGIDYTNDTVRAAFVKLEARATAAEAIAAKPTLANFPKAQAKRAANQRAIIYCVGDSLTASWGSGAATGPGSGGAGSVPNFKKAQSHPAQFAALMNTAGVPARADAFFSCTQSGNTIALVADSEPRITFGTGWVVSTIPSLGGHMLQCTNGSSGLLSYTPQFAANSFEFYVSGASGLGMLTVTDANGTLGVIDESVISATDGVILNSLCYRKVTLTRATSSTLPISIQRTGTGDIYLGGIVPFDTTSPRLELINMGWPGSRATGTTNTNSWNSTDTGPWAPPNAIGILRGDAFLIELGANDAAASATSTSFQSGLQSVISRVAPNGDVVLAKTNTATTGDSYNVSAAYLSAVDALVASNSLKPAVDYNSITMTSADRFDNIHLSQAGYAKKAAALKTYAS